MDTSLFYLLTAVGGLLLASFFSVVIHRVPRGESIVKPRSHCTACNATLGFVDLIPVLGWLLSGGKCRQCGAKVAFRYLLLEILVPLLLLYAAWQDGPGWLFARDAIFISLLVILSFIDLDTLELPHPFTIAGQVSGLAFAAAGVASGIGIHWSHAALGLAVGYVLPALISSVYKMIRGQDGMGGGDFMLLAMIGAHVGPVVVVFAFLVAVFLSAAIGGILLMRAQKGERSKVAIPFGPFLALGGLVALFWGERLVNSYLSTMG